MDCRFEALVFDMDGTLTRPVIDFDGLRRDLGMAQGDLVDEIEKLPPEQQRAAWAIVERHEARAMEELQPQEGCAEFLAKCNRNGIKLGVVTRNVQRSVDLFCRQCGVAFDGVVTREFGILKPRPEPVQHLLEQWRIAPGAALMIGDYVYDIQSGKAAGTRTCFFHNPGHSFYGQEADHVVRSMVELDRLVFPGPG